MRLKITSIIFISLITTSLFAQLTTTNITIKWKGIEKWTLGQSSVDVLSFESALYPDGTRLPYFHKRFSIDNAHEYSFEIKNISTAKLSDIETNLLCGQTFGSDPRIIQNTKIQAGERFVDVEILPVISRDGQVLKITSFDLIATKSLKAQKAKVSTLHSYASNSLLAQGRFVKIKISQSGVFKLTYENLLSMGINPAEVRIFGYGGGMLEQNFALSKLDDLPEVAIYMNKGADNVFNAGDYILFYGQGPTKWAYDRSKGLFTHTINPYSLYGYYFVTSDAGSGKRIEEQTDNIPANATINNITEFSDYDVHEKELVNLAQGGREFYGESFNDNSTSTINVQFPNITALTIRLDAAANATTTSYFYMTLNGGQQKTLGLSSRPNNNYAMGTGANGTYTFTSPTDNSSVGLMYSKPNSTAIGYLNYLEMNARRKLIMTGSVMPFQNTDNLGTGTYNKYTLTNAGTNVQIWDMTDQQNMYKVGATNNSGTITFTADGNTLRNYLAIDPTNASAFSSPDIVGAISNQNLHATAQADFVIITHPDFLQQANEVAQLHRDKDSMTCEVFTTDQVYNEFSSGTPDATAYRWLMKMLYDRALASGVKSDLPKYLMLFGTGSYDNRKIVSNSGNNLILTYQAENSLETTSSYVTDDYFGFLDDNEGAYVPANLLDLGIGRLPVSTVTQANDVVSKIRNYMEDSGKGIWKNQLCFVADDGGNGDKVIHMSQADSIASSISRTSPSFQLNKIYLDAFQQETTASGESYPLAKTKLSNLIRSGLLYLNYTGHASANGWANEGVLTLSDVKKLSNSKLPLFFGATCDFLQYDCGSVSAGEYVLTNPSGGGIGIISAARPVYSNQNMTLNKYFCDQLFKMENGVMPRIGDALKKAKNTIGTEINKLIYVYMGDPALRLDYPNDYKVVTSQFNNNATLGNDTLKALAVAKVKGYIADNNGNKVTNFNGTVHTVVYDKVQRITTLNNHNEGAFIFSDRPNMLFSGSNAVKNGEFTVTFMVPKDIRYNYGTGRINYYTVDSTDSKEGQGYYENVIIGGTDKNYTMEYDGPEASIFLNTLNFKSGDKVNETPLFIANVADVHGINTVGSGIGHDVSICIDNDPAQTYILNDYYTAIQDSYSEGTIQYQIPEMTEGKHTLAFKVWDLLNNSTSKEINFEVVKGLSPVIFSVNVYPNPVKTSAKANIIVAHDRPETILYTTVDIYDISGRKVWTFTQTGADKIEWNLSTVTGMKLSTGVYLCRVSVKTSSSDITTKTAKILISE